MSQDDGNTGQDIAPARKKLLHLEDDPDFLSYVAFILEDIADIDQALTLQQGRELISQNSYDLILLDLYLPDGSGMVIVNDLKSQHSSIPIVIFSVDSVSSDTDYVSKVFQKGHFNERSLINAIRVLTA